MKHLAWTAMALGMAGTLAQAGGMERRTDPSQILFEAGRNYLEFSVLHANPSVSGGRLPSLSGPVPGGPTGNIANSFESYAFGYKADINDRLSAAIVIDEPVGASVAYNRAGATFAGSSADVSSLALTAMAKYKLADRISVYGGLRIQAMDGSITVISPVTTPNPYNLVADKDYKAGYLLGAAYEIPDIALRLAMTYESRIKHDFRDNTTGTEFDVEIPQAVTLHAQSGIAANTLLFGSIRWREWTAFNVSPADFNQNPIASGTSDVWTYELGLGRRFSDSWSGAFLLGYEEDTGKRVGNLEGKDGYISYGLAATYTTEKWELTTGLRYFDIGGADTAVARFGGNSAIAFGTRIAFRF